MPVSRFRFPGPSVGLLLLAAFLLLQTGCRPVRELPTAPATPAAVTVEVPPGYHRYRVVPAESEVRALVYRSGPMARLGHNHVLSSKSLAGEILLADSGADARVALVLPVASFTVDQAKLRLEEGADFPGAVDEDAISGTRKNLLSEALLDEAHFPEIRLTSRNVTGRAPDFTVTVAIEVKGRTHELRVPVRVEQRANELRATGEFTATHAELGLTPFTVMGGLLSVRDDITLRFRIVARPG